jgi:hypothetical protein
MPVLHMFTKVVVADIDVLSEGVHVETLLE